MEENKNFSLLDDTKLNFHCILNVFLLICDEGEIKVSKCKKKARNEKKEKFFCTL